MVSLKVDAMVALMVVVMVVLMVVVMVVLWDTCLVCSKEKKWVAWRAELMDVRRVVLTV